MPHFYDLQRPGAFGQARAAVRPVLDRARARARAAAGIDELLGPARRMRERASGRAVRVDPVLGRARQRPRRRAAYRDFLVALLRGAAARRPLRAAARTCRLRDVMEWLDLQGGRAERRAAADVDRARLPARVPRSTRSGLLLTKFLRRSAEIGVRRALGASKRSIFVQLLVEAGVDRPRRRRRSASGSRGSACGPCASSRRTYAELARLDLPMLATTFALAVVASLLAGLLPAWRGCQVTPGDPAQVALRRSPCTSSPSSRRCAAIGPPPR